MKKTIKVINVWLKAEKSLLETSLKGSYTSGWHEGYIKALDMVKELLSASQQKDSADIIDTWPLECCLCNRRHESVKLLCEECR